MTAFTLCLHKAEAEGVISLTRAHAWSYKGPIPIMQALQLTSSKPKCIPKMLSSDIRLQANVPAYECKRHKKAKDKQKNIIQG